jgi:RNA polymerase subunit RPABC4/transcription elongation factor Spt4
MPDSTSVYRIARECRYLDCGEDCPQCHGTGWLPAALDCLSTSTLKEVAELVTGALGERMDAERYPTFERCKRCQYVRSDVREGLCGNCGQDLYDDYRAQQASDEHERIEAERYAGAR